MTPSMKEYLFSARQIMMDPSTRASLVLDIVRQGEVFSPGQLSWACVCAVVQMAIIGGHGDNLKEKILEHYEAATGDKDTVYMRRLHNIACMFGEHAFERRVPPPPPSDRERHAIERVIASHEEELELEAERKRVKNSGN